MEPLVHFHQDSRDEVPQVSITDGATTLTFPWPVWEQLVHRASYDFVTWALARPQAYADLEDQVLRRQDPSITARRWLALAN